MPPITKKQFQDETSSFMTRDEHKARDLAAQYNARGVDGETIVAAKFGDQWCVMLARTYAFTQEMGIS